MLQRALPLRSGAEAMGVETRWWFVCAVVADDGCASLQVRMLVVAGVRPCGGVRYKCANGEDGGAVTVPICCYSGCCCRWSCAGGVAEARWSERKRTRALMDGEVSCGRDGGVSWDACAAEMVQIPAKSAAAVATEKVRAELRWWSEKVGGGGCVEGGRRGEN